MNELTDMTDKELLEALRGDRMLSAITVLLNVAAFGSTSLYEDGSDTENRLMQLETAKFLHSLHSDRVFEIEHSWLLNQIKLHERYVEPSDLALTDIELEVLK